MICLMSCIGYVNGSRYQIKPGDVVDRFRKHGNKIMITVYKGVEEIDVLIDKETSIKNFGLPIKKRNYYEPIDVSEPIGTVIVYEGE